MKTWKIPPISEGWKEAIARYRSVLLVIGLGLLLMAWPSQETEVPGGDSAGEVAFDVTAFETHVAEHLSMIQGAGETRVVLTLKNNGTAVYAQDVVADPGGKSSATTVTIGSGSNQVALPVEQNYPAFQGALVICPGGDNPGVQLALISAVSALTGLGSNSISVCKGK